MSVSIRRWIPIHTLVLAASTYFLATARSHGQTVQFNRDIRPILADNCFACHGPDKNTRKADFRLDDRASALKRSIIVPGNPGKSLLLQRVNTSNTALVMPPASSTKKLTAAQRALLARWIKEGAKYQGHWSYIAPQRPAVPVFTAGALTPGPSPASGRGEIIRNPIDAFVGSVLAKKGIRPSPEADRRTLIRRVYLDLTGIPPTPAEVAAFLADRSASAYEKVVDRLLASPRYGERMAIPWLDIVRYADTVGYHGDQNFNAWAYRDYVIKSFNENKPFDRFTLEQIAGDLLPNPTPEMLTATCFNRLNMMTREGGAQPKEYLAKYAADRVRTVSMAWLGSTMGCAECHDHKYDPFTQKDFYSLAAFFSDVKQWGVYQDYDYTPNPDLKGWSNDHPWPPEINVESEYLRNRIQQNRERVRKIALDAGERIDRKTFDAWRRTGIELLARSPDGWQPAVEPEVLSVDGKKSPDKPYGSVLPDGSLLVAADAPGEVGVLFKPGVSSIASVKLDLLQDKAYGDTILRPSSGRGFRASFRVQRADGKAENLAIRHANAAHYEPRYYNGFDILGVQSVWQLHRDHLKETNSSLWILDRPVTLGEGERILVSFRGARPGRVRISTSPFAPDDPYALTLPTDLNRVLRDAQGAAQGSALEAYLRGTGWQPEAFARVKRIDADTLECRRGITPVMVVESVKPMVTRVFPRGNWQDESGPVVQPAVPSFLPQIKLPVARRLTRLDLAEWLTSRENPLTSRMFVNRLWKQFFGTALSDKVEDLGTQGETPSHPEMLDWLAVEFMKPSRGALIYQGSTNGWDVKHIVRLIVTSATYRQSSKPRPELKAVDPGNRLLASQNPRRLEAELVRDNALAIAGLINLDMGGPPCKPYQPAGYYANLQFPDREYQPDDNDRQWRRTVYSHWQRTFLHPMLANFDAPSREDCVAIRTAANTPQQALTLLNDPEFVEASRTFAAKIFAAGATDVERLARAFDLALGRPIKPNERESLLAFLAKVRKEYAALPEDAKKLLQVGVSPATQGDPVEMAAWTSVCRVILNLHETITRY